MDQVNLIPDIPDEVQFKRLNETQFQLPEMDFQNGPDIATPDEIPDHSEHHREIPLEIKRSATVEALMAQNDDLIARLKVNLRRLTLLENENDRVRQIHRVLENKNIALSDQQRIFEEKEKLWRNKERTLESVVNDFKTRLPEYENLSEKLDRYKKYHERIKTQVKPFIHQLKAYADSLMGEIQKLNAEVSDREATIEKLKFDQASMLSEIEKQRHQAESRQELLVVHFERQKQESLLQIREQQLQIGRLEERAQAYDVMRSREDELSNVIVALRRQKMDNDREASEKHNVQLAELTQIRSELSALREATQDQARKMDVSKSERARLESQSQQLEEQLGSLRYLWNSKSDELEKTRASLASMEKLNAELSRQLTSLRRDSEM